MDESEGTGVWTAEEGMRLHIPIPTIAAAHQFRVASADQRRRQQVVKAAGGPLSTTSRIEKVGENALEDLRLALYAGFLASFIQGLTLLAKADAEERWGINFANVVDIWRAGCIIRSGYISDILNRVYSEGGQGVHMHPLSSHVVAAEFKKTYQPLKKLVIQSTITDAVIPSIAATLEYLKYSTTDHDLPTEFMEAELDYFGNHMFDIKSEDPGKPATGKFHDCFFFSLTSMFSCSSVLFANSSTS